MKICVRQGCHTKIVETNFVTHFRLIEFQDFNPRMVITIRKVLFQSTHPCGARQGIIARFVASLVLALFQISHEVIESR